MRNAKGERLLLRCLSYRDYDKVVSVCIDLDIFAEASEREESKDKLIDAITLYLKHAVENDEVEKLVPRKAPLKYRFMYYWNDILEAFRRFSRHKSTVYRFSYPIHLNVTEDTGLFG